MPVDISRIQKINDGINTSGEFPVMEAWDDAWGYYTFTQTVSYSYDETGTSGLSSAEIIINGKFTINACQNGKQNNGTDEDNSNILFCKYDKLRKLIISKMRQVPPSNFGQIGTINDARCVKLPERLLSHDGYIYAIPVSFTMTDASPHVIGYSAVFKELTSIPCKIAIGESIIDDAVVSITCRKPRINPRIFAFAHGGESYFTGIDNRKYRIDGVFRANELSNSSSYIDYINISESSNSCSFADKCSSVGLSKDNVDLANEIIEGDSVDLSVGRNGSATRKFVSIYVISNSINMSSNGETRISIEGEECNVVSSS